LPPRAWFYFTHSYVCVPEDATLNVGHVDYGIDFCAAVARDNVFACQFHPEKSQEEGHLLLSRFVRGQGWS
jgi:glutamine amidotransferase